MVSVIIPKKKEEQNLPACLDVVDSGHSNRTVEIASGNVEAFGTNHYASLR